MMEKMKLTPRDPRRKKRRQTRIPGKEQNENHKKKEGRYNPGGQVSMRWRRTVSVLAQRSEVHSSFCNHWRIFGDDGKNSTITKGSEKKEEKTNKNTRKRTDWESQEERRQIQPRW